MYILDVLMGCMYVGDLLLKLHLACVIQFEYYKVVITNGPGILKIYTLEVCGGWSCCVWPAHRHAWHFCAAWGNAIC
jgi:hypothetical protein